MERRVALCIPTWNGGKDFLKLAASIRQQKGLSFATLVIDSGSMDGTVEAARRNGFRVCAIDGKTFDHGGTRQQGCEWLSDAEIVVFLTQDAILAKESSLADLAACFAEPAVGLAYGRQLPRNNAGPFSTHARLFNYPPQRQVRSKEDSKQLGLKAAFASDSFAAYRQAALAKVGGFPSKVILGEDMLVAAKLLLADWQVVYCAEAEVYHSHEYTLRQEFRRYFDTGVFHAREAWLKATFGAAEGEGARFVQSEIRYLWNHGCGRLLPEALLRTIVKYAGYKAGTWERLWPVHWKQKWSMHRNFWR